MVETQTISPKHSKESTWRRMRPSTLRRLYVVPCRARTINTLLKHFIMKSWPQRVVALDARDGTERVPECMPRTKMPSLVPRPKDGSPFKRFFRLSNCGSRVPRLETVRTDSVNFLP